MIKKKNNSKNSFEIKKVVDVVVPYLMTNYGPFKDIFRQFLMFFDISYPTLFVVKNEQKQVHFRGCFPV